MRRKYPPNSFFTADPHYYHENIIKYCNRPFKDGDEAAEVCIENHNSVVGKNDYVFMLGDFTWLKSEAEVWKLIARLNGKLIFIRGNHDYWIKGHIPDILDINIEGQPITLSHYAMRVWNKSHFNAWNLHGHSHGTLSSIGKQLDVGVDCHNYTPVSFEHIKGRMDELEDNFNLIRK